MRIKNAFIAAGLAALVIAGATPAAATPGGQPASGVEHCPDGGAWTAKVNTTGDPDTIDYTAPDGYVVVETCVKAGLTTQYDSYEPGQTTVTLDHREKDSISHWSARLAPAPVVDPEPETPQRPEDVVEYGEWTESWECGDTVAQLERSVTVTSWEWDESAGEYVPFGKSSLERDTRPLTEDELAACEEDPEPRDPDLDGTTVGSKCDANAPYLTYDIVVNDPDGVLAGQDSATITFVNPGGTNWTTTVPVGDGTVLWPGVTYSGDTVTAWPGYVYDSASDSWIDVGNDNFGWTRADFVTVMVDITATKSFQVTYPASTPECKTTIVIVSDNTGGKTPVKTPVKTPTKTPVAAPKGTSKDAPAATAVKAEATYTG